MQKIHCGHTLVRICKDEFEMGVESARIAIDAIKNRAKERENIVMWMMAAPSGFAFYDAFVKEVCRDRDLQEIVKSTRFFQFDDYPVGRGDARFPITFRHLLETYFFSPLEKILGQLEGKFLLELTGTSADVTIIKDYEKSLKSVLSDERTFVLEIKGIGMDGHWGFHGSETPLDRSPAFMRVPMNKLNIQQQMLDWPEYFPNEDSVPVEVITANVALFMQADMIIDLVPQPEKSFSILATYGPTKVSPLVPSSMLKKHPDSHAFLTEAAAWALISFLEHKTRTVDPAVIERLKKIWYNKFNPELQTHNERKMMEVLDTLFQN